MLIGTTARSPRGTIEASLLIGGKPVPLYRRTDGALFAAGHPGVAYTLRVRNLTGQRIEVISSVDGRHTLKDERACQYANRGLVFSAHSTGQFTGWRLNDDETREFLFGAPERSVAAAATGSAANVGVIGFAAWRERQRFGTDYAVAGAGGDWGGGLVTRSANASVTRDFARGLGTGIGERQSDHVGRTDFTRESGEPDILAIYYDTREALDAMGITGPAEPNPFPGIGTGYEKYATT